jgi:hypothetical protein
LNQHPEGGCEWHSKPEVILDHDSSEKGSDELVALHPVGVVHPGVDSEAVSLRSHVVPGVGDWNEKRQLVAHQLLLECAEHEGSVASLLDISLLVGVIQLCVETVVSVLHHGEVSISQQAELEKLSEGRSSDEIRIVLDAKLEEVIRLLSVVSEGCLALAISLFPELEKRLLEEAHLDRWQEQILVLLNLVSDRLLGHVFLEVGVFDETLDGLA